MNMSLDSAKTFFQGPLSRNLSRAALQVKKYSPEILVGAGVIGFVATTVLACKATLKVDEVLAKTEPDLEKIKTVWQDQLANPVYIFNTESEKSEVTYQYTETDYKKDLAMTYVRRGADLAKLYAPALGLGVLSIGLVLGSQGIMKKRNLGLMAAYALLDETFNTYRANVVADLGSERDLAYRHSYHMETKDTVTVDADGKKSKKKETVYVPNDDLKRSPYAKFFDEFSAQWSKDPEHNLFFLRAQQNYANDLLKSHGHVFLNEVYDLLGIPRTSAGAVVGWVRNSDAGDSFIDFGIYSPSFAGGGPDFVNGYERSILLDFNVDGVIYDKI